MGLNQVGECQRAMRKDGLRVLHLMFGLVVVNKEGTRGAALLVCGLYGERIWE